MSNLCRTFPNLPLEQQAIRAKCFHPSGNFVEFKKEEVEQSIPSRFEQIVREYPDRIAVKTENHVLTYAELNATANRVARAILAQQGSVLEPVGLLFEKDAPLMAAMLGVLKAGKFFVLLDPSFPKTRMAAVLEDSQTQWVLTDERNVLLARDASGSRCQLIEFDSTDRSIPAEDLRLSVSPTALALIFHTSGSTGQPKGVVQNHRNLLHNMMLRTNAIHVCEHDRITLLPSGTSNTVTNSFLALLNGAALLPFDVKKQGATRLVNWISQERISICLISAALFRSLCENLRGNEVFPDLRVIRLRSEAVYKTDVDLYRKYLSPNCIFVNGLSSSETGPLSEYLINHNSEITGNEVPVGYAVDGKEVLLLDDAGRQIGFNEIGVIAVRSRYLSPGYWLRPQLTEAKFRSGPDGGEDRFYLTGDLGLMRPDGCLVHKGRKDYRVKVRGYGVDITEVEMALLNHGAVREAVVVPLASESGDARLVAYFTSRSQLGPTVSDLRRFMRTKLAEYMIPAAFVKLDAMPLTLNGKVDRRALPTPDNSRPDLEVPFAAPNTSIEEKLTKIWTELLGLDRVGIHDNFFDLGGHSLMATQVLSRIRDDFQIELALAHFFETPTVAALADYIERARLPQDGAEVLRIQPASRDGQIPLSFAQERLWFLDQLVPGSSTYNMLSAYQLTGKLNVAALERSVNEIIRRHESWRTLFKAIDGKPQQIILPSLGIQIPVVDLRAITSAAERQSEVSRLLTAGAQRPFDLARGPLLRLTLLRLTEHEHLLLLVRHHIVYDGWCRGIIARELSVFYEAFAGGRQASLPDLPIQYADFAHWQRQWSQGEVLEEQISYWTKRLESVAALQLPTDRPRPPVQTSHGARQYFVLSERLSAALRNLSNRCGVTLFMTLLGAYQTLLHRYTGKGDIVIGTAIAGRNRSELENLIGLFLNVLVLRTDFSGDPTFRALLDRVREVCLEAYAHQDVPFEKLVEELHPERTLSHNPLFQVTFSLQNTPRFPLVLDGLGVKELEVDAGITRFDLELFIEDVKSSLQGYVNYSTDLFDAVTIERMLGHMQTLLEGIVANPEQRLSELPLLTGAERHQLMAEWNDTQTRCPNDACIHQLFEAQVERTPEAVAAVFEEQQLTYLELNRRANRLAHYLRKLGVGPDVLVGLCMERSLEMVVSVLGILKAGGAYVPVDPEYPKERLAFMLEDSQAGVLLTKQALVEKFPRYPAHVLCLDSDWEAIAEESGENPARGVMAGNLAYVIYTSGSTGTPKGVLVPHRGLYGLAQEQTGILEVGPGSRVLQFSSLSFDASTFEIVMALATGATLCLGSPDSLLPGPTLIRLLQDQGITIVTLPPSALAALPVEKLPALRTITVAGEACSAELVTRWVAGRRFFNLYGPTEATIWATAAQLHDGIRTPPIGRPIANVQTYLLDPYLRLVPVGVPGELHIGGAGVARGYLNRPDLTAEKFIPNPFSDEPSARLYKTGDLARYLPDGNIEFLGRIDHQVKIRGFRIELGEIGTVLSQHPEVRETVVAAREDAPGDRRLVAYVVPNHEPAPSTSELRGFLKQKLPEYMLPSAFVFLNSLPLAPNGKVDRRSLPTPDRSRPDLKETFVAPRTLVEKVLAGIWSEVLAADKMSIQDNFFDLGGHSLKATQVASRVREAFRIELPVRNLFEAPTIADLAERIETILSAGHEPQPVPNGAQGDRVEVEL